MDISDEVANIHMKTDARNLVTTATTIHLLEQKETIHMTSMLRKEACSRSIHDLAHIPTQNCSADCLTKSSAKANNLIKAVKTGRLFEVDVHLKFCSLMAHKAFLFTWCTTCLHTRENDVFFLTTLKDSLAPDLREAPFHVMCERNQQIHKQNELNICEFENQDATTMTSASADSRVNCSWMIMSFWVRTLCLRLVLMTIFSVLLLCPNLCDHDIIFTEWCSQSEQMDTKVD